jgi:hypothetical protein
MKFKNNPTGSWECSSVVECVLSTHEALDPNANTKEGGKETREERRE